MTTSHRNEGALARAVAAVRRNAAGVPIVPVVLSGGAGTRLWPLSRRFEPKQFQKLAGERTLFQDTLERFGEPCFARPLVVANAEQEALLRRDTAEMARSARPFFVFEPSIRSTAAPIACAALLLAEREGEDTVMMITPSDHKVTRPEELLEAVANALPFVREGSIALFGIEPTRPETGFGYIEVGSAVRGAVHRIDRFVEKPDEANAERFLRSRHHLWNSGMFLATARTMLEEIDAYMPGLLDAARLALGEAERGEGWVRLGAAFDALPAVAIDRGVMERSERLGVVPVLPGWSDLGTFQSLWREGERDGAGNVVGGHTLLHEVENSLVHAEKRLVCVFGLSNVCVVETADAILVGPLDRTDAIKDFVAQLTAAGDPAALRRPTPADEAVPAPVPPLRVA